MQISFLRLMRCMASVVVIVSLGLCFGSCGSPRQLIYMQGKFDTATLSKIVVNEQLIQKGDILSIIVFSDNPEATKIYNQTIIASTGTQTTSGGEEGAATPGLSGSAPSGGGYLVDQKGDIQFQGLGKLHVEGLDRNTLQDTLMARLKNFLINPYCTIKFLNYRFTILGEVQRPGIFTIPGDRLSLLQALGMCGDMTYYGRRDNILVIRETEGKREWARLDITKPEIMASPFFYLKSNDVVIVEPTKKKIAASDQITTRNIGIATGIISTLAIIYSILRR